MNVILNPDRTRKNVVSVDETIARSAECPIDILPEDIFVTDAPAIPEDMHTPRLTLTGVWEEANPDAAALMVYNLAKSEIESAIDAHIISVVKEHGYNSPESCASYIGDINPQWNAEAQAFKDWRSSVWAYVIGEFAKVSAGQRTMPTPFEAISELPIMVWP